MSRWWWPKKEEVPSSSTDFSSPCPKNGYYDVFLSFRGEDTRYGFTSYLYRLLRENKVYTFMDVDLTGEDIDYLFKMVEKSRMAVVIYSESFASSDWCLRELDMILQRRKEKKMLIIPIFYKVDVHELKHLTGKTAECLDKLIPKHGETTVQKWKDIITNFGNISGLSYKNNYGRYEYDFIMEVIVKIKKKLGEFEEIQKSCIVKSHHEDDLDNFALQHRQEDIGSSSTQSSSADTTNTTTGNEEQVYRVVTSTYFQKSSEDTGKLLSVKPNCLPFIVEPEKESSTLLIFSNNTDNCVAFWIQCTTEPLKYRVCPSEGLVLPRSTCQVIVTMEAQSTVYPASEYVKRSEKFLVQSVIAKNDSYNSTDDFSDLFKKESANCIDAWWMSVLCIAPPKRLSSIPDHLSQLVNKGFVLGTPNVYSIDTHPIKPWLLLGLSYGSVCIWNYETRAEEKSFKVVDELVVFAKFIHEKQWFVAGGRNGFVHVFDYNTSELVKEFKAHEDDFRCMAVHLTSPYVLTASIDKLIKLWNWENDWACIETFEGHSDIVMQVAFNPKDSKSFASASMDGTIKLWSFDSQIAKFTINAHDKGLTSTEYFVGNDDKLYLLSGSDDYCARVWDYESKTLVKTLEGHSSDVQTTLVHPKLPIIITGSIDKTIRIWNKNTHRLELVWNCDLGVIWSMRFIKTSDEVVLGCDSGIIVIKIVNAETQSN